MTKYQDFLVDRATGSDYSWGVAKREAKVIGFTETQGRGLAVSADLSTTGEIDMLLVGVPPQGEKGTVDTCRRLVNYFNRNERIWSQPKVTNDLHLDAIATNAVGTATEFLKMQVVRAITKRKFWEKLQHDGKISIKIPIDEAAAMVQKAIALKVKKIPLAERSTITLVLDATDVPALAFDETVEALRTRIS